MTQKLTLPPEILYDVRLIARNLQQGLITQASLKAHIEALPDGANSADGLALPDDAAPAK